MVTRHKMGLGAAALALLVLSPPTTSQVVQAQPDDARLARFDTVSPNSKVFIDYAAFDRVLAAFVIDDGNSTAIRYAALKGDGLRILKRMIAALEGFDTAELGPDEQLAYWLNLRMLVVMHATGDAFPAARPEQWFKPDSAALTMPLVTVAGVPLSVADIDRIILKKARSNPHVGYGMVVPLREAPAFPKVAYRGATAHSALEAAGRSFVNRRGTIKLSKDVVTLPRFLTGYRSHFGQDDAALIAHVKALAAPKFAQQLASATQLGESRRYTLNNFVERNFSDFADSGLYSQPQGGGGLGS